MHRYINGKSLDSFTKLKNPAYLAGSAKNPAGYRIIPKILPDIRPGRISGASLIVKAGSSTPLVMSRRHSKESVRRVTSKVSSCTISVPPSCAEILFATVAVRRHFGGRSYAGHCAEILAQSAHYAGHVYNNMDFFQSGSGLRMAGTSWVFKHRVSDGPS